MSEQITIQLEEIPEELSGFHFPKALDQRLQDLLDKQDRGKGLTARERQEAEGLVNLAELLTILQFRAQQASPPRTVSS